MTTRSALSTKPRSAVPASITHVCPVCGASHRVSPARAEMAYGRQLCCSPDCEGERRRAQRRAPNARQAASDAGPTESRSASWVGSAAMIALLLVFLGAGFALRFWRFYPHFL